MTKVKKAILMIVLLLLTFTLCLTVVNGKISKAETAQEDNSAYGSEREEVTPRGIYTRLTFAINGGNGQVWVTAKNEFTLFPAKVIVNLQLYHSDFYEENYNNMTLVAVNSIDDLDQGKTLTASASINGKSGYWKARAYYKIDNKDWQEYLSDTLLFNADGIRVF